MWCYKRGLQLHVEVISFVGQFVSQSVRIVNFHVNVKISFYHLLTTNSGLINEKHRWSYEWYFLPCNNQNTTPYYVQTSANFSLRRWSIVYNLAFVINIAYTVHSTINNNHSSKQTHVHFLCLLSVTLGAILSLSIILFSGLSKKSAIIFLIVMVNLLITVLDSCNRLFFSKSTFDISDCIRYIHSYSCKMLITNTKHKNVGKFNRQIPSREFNLNHFLSRENCITIK